MDNRVYYTFLSGINHQQYDRRKKWTILCVSVWCSKLADIQLYFADLCVPWRNANHTDNDPSTVHELIDVYDWRESMWYQSLEGPNVLQKGQEYLASSITKIGGKEANFSLPVRNNRKLFDHHPIPYRLSLWWSTKNTCERRHFFFILTNIYESNRNFLLEFFFMHQPGKSSFEVVETNLDL